MLASTGSFNSFPSPFLSPSTFQKAHPPDQNIGVDEKEKTYVVGVEDGEEWSPEEEV